MLKILTAPLGIQLPAITPGKAAEDDPNTCAPVLTWEICLEFQSLGIVTLWGMTLPV